MRNIPAWSVIAGALFRLVHIVGANRVTILFVGYRRIKDFSAAWSCADDFVDARYLRRLWRFGRPPDFPGDFGLFAFDGWFLGERDHRNRRGEKLMLERWRLRPASKE
jgi:hypothetical protein